MSTKLWENKKKKLSKSSNNIVSALSADANI